MVTEGHLTQVLGKHGIQEVDQGVEHVEFFPTPMLMTQLCSWDR